MTMRRLQHFDTEHKPPRAGDETPSPRKAEASGGSSAEETSEDEKGKKAAEILGGYVVSITGRRSWRRLHYLGRCWRQPGKDYASFQTYGEESPPASAYDAVCKDCWKGGILPLEDGEEEEGISSDSSEASAVAEGPQPP